MGIFDFLFSKKDQKQRSERSTSKDTPLEVATKTGSDNDEVSFATPEPIVRIAFNSVMSSVDASDDTKAKLYKDYLREHTNGNPRGMDEVIVKRLKGSGWRWLWFDQWESRFSESNTWPAMWFEYSETYSKPGGKPDQPRSFSEALGLFSSKALKKWLKENGIKGSSQLKRKQLEEFITKQILWSTFLPAALDAHQTAYKYYEDKRDKLRCQLLSHTITMMAYRLRRQKECRGISAIAGYFWTVIPDPDNNPFSVEAAEKFNSGQSDALPPCFPGDRSYIRLTRHL